jgi:hypothetical protein
MSLHKPEEPLFEGGSMRLQDWYDAEVDIDPNLPGWEMPELPAVTIVTEAFGEILLHPLNTKVVRYDGAGDKTWEHTNHIEINEPSVLDIPIFMFKGYEEDTRKSWTDLARALMERDFPLIAPYTGQPEPLVMEMYYQEQRGQEPIESIIRQIVELEGGERV